MRILVTNDDGVHHPGLRILVKALKDEGEVVVVAPDRDQSGMGLAMTLMSVVRAHEIAPAVPGIKTFSVEGTPADCVILATEALVKEPIDLVVSGINPGANMGLDVMNSGTVGGAFHGYFRNIPSIAVSVAYVGEVQYDTAAQTARTLARAISRHPLPNPLLLNVNLPAVAQDKIEAVQITTLGPKAYESSVEQGVDGRRTHYWIRHARPTGAVIEEGTDIWAVRNNCVSITPLDPALGRGRPSPAFEVLADEVSSGLGVRTKVDTCAQPGENSPKPADQPRSV